MFAVLFFSFLRRVFIVVHGISLVVATELLIVMASRCGAWTLGVWASVEMFGLSVVVHGLSCSLACGISPEYG